MTASSFNCTPGLPVLHSRDLVNWSLIGHAVKNLPHPRYAKVQPGCGIWAPAIRFHAGKFWIFFPRRTKASMSPRRNIPQANGPGPIWCRRAKG